LEGITREVVMELAPACGLVVKEDVLTRYDLYTADELFLTGTAAEIISVVNVDRRVIGAGKPGPHTLRLLAAFGEETKATGTPIG
jgi:branched-chain amino acid aminotransferase